MFKEDLLVKGSTPSSSVLVKEDWVDESLTVLASAQGESHVEMKENPFTESSLPIFDATTEKIDVVIQSLMKDKEEGEKDVPLKWKMKNLRGNKEKEKSKKTAKVVKTYTTRSEEKKLLNDALKTIKSAATKRRRLKIGIVIDVDNVYIVDVG